MVPWIQVYSNLIHHPKTTALADELELKSGDVNPNAIAAGMLVSLWTWAVQNAYNGDLSECSDRAIAEACLWKKKPSTIVDALINAGWIDVSTETGKRVTTLHDWGDYATLLVDAEENRRSKTRERVQRYRDRKRNESETKV